MQTVVSRFTTVDGGLSFDPATEEELLRFDQPTVIHNGGDLHFGPDGFLYAGFGDGGITSNSQDVNNLFGAIIRIDVDNAGPSGEPYAIPPGNPFAGGGGAPEIFAWGLRNPYRFGFDPLTGVLWAADVGQALEEEVDIIVAGGNYGWPIKEGNSCFSGDCATPGLTDPEFTYSHTLGCAIVGGRVYRGSAVPELDGAYIYGDYCSRQIWAAVDDGSGEYETSLLTSAVDFLGSF